jgi:hypothetical protein
MRNSERSLAGIRVLFPSDGKLSVVGRISTDKRACIDWAGHLPVGRQLGSYPETVLWNRLQKRLQNDQSSFVRVCRIVPLESGAGTYI